MPHPTTLTAAGELAARYLKAAGSEVVRRDWRCAYGGLDLVVRDAGTTAFVTVVTAPDSRGRRAPVSMPHTEQRRIRRLALLWPTEQDGLWQRIRFDVVSVLPRRGPHSIDRAPQGSVLDKPSVALFEPDCAIPALVIESGTTPADGCPQGM
ncbi:YraN family protein [Nocardia sp. NPDC058499]|uniref:YraN family protein n=1 Tax=Nocardia sp. NPDC058499 TaxID=3346530 RepID=UPI003657309A